MLTSKKNCLVNETPHNFDIITAVFYLRDDICFVLQMWISRAEYEESGPSIVHRKCF